MRYAASILAFVACGKHEAQRVERGAAELAVAVASPGATTTELASVATSIEAAIAHVDGVAALHTRIAFGSVATTIELAPGTELDVATSRVQAQIAAIATQLPAGIERPT